MVERIMALVFMVVVFSSLASAAYTSGDIHIYENGETRFDVESDVALDITGLSFNNEQIKGTTDILTSKSGSVWTFSLDFGEYDTILLDIHLPKNLDSITSIEGVDNIIDIENKVITLIDSGKLDFSVSYKLKNSSNYSWIAWPAILLILLVAYAIIKQTRKRKEHIKHILPLINEQEQKILDALMSSPKRQKELRKSLNIPKASFSRYLVNLEKKKLILREGEGKNKIVKLK